jgi:alpha-L-fucosidase
MMQSVLLVILSATSTTLAFLFYNQKKKNIEMLAQTLEFFMLQGQMEQESKTEKDRANEDFLKFISDSRDWAYQYIEDTQAKINNFINDIEPEISYFDEYGMVGDAYPHYYSMKKISEAYKELKTILPEDYGKIDI